MWFQRPEGDIESRASRALAGAIAGGLVAASGFAFLIGLCDGFSQSAAVGAVAGGIAGALMARKGILAACIVAGLASLFFGCFGTIALMFYAFSHMEPVPG
jgi:uncharacterized protein YcfJ